MTEHASPLIPAWQFAFVERHGLNSDYLRAAQYWFMPLAARIARHRVGANRPFLVAVNGCQGSGKSTLVDYLADCLGHCHGLRCARLSLDDVYLTRQQRRQLAQSVHPLLATRGVPGTHDLALLQSTLDCLLDARGSGELRLPRFDKSLDDRAPVTEWPQLALPVDVILLEGWCLGAGPQTLAELRAPVNALEREEDHGGHWRGYVNTVLARDFPAIYERVDRWLMLQAPSFACVRRWRQEQEDKLRHQLGSGHHQRTMDAAGIERFVQFFQRLTESMLEHLPRRMDELFRLDEERRIVEVVIR